MYKPYKSLNFKLFPILIMVFAGIFPGNATPPDGGMFPISMINSISLNKKGLKVPVSEIYNPGGNALIQAVVNIGGCTGSFLSEQGLIVTNHHCVFGSLAPYSTPENNLLEKGYLADNQSKELPIKGLTCKIMESYQDISADVLNGADTIKDAVKRKQTINKNIGNIKQAEQLKHPEYQIEISEMLPGKSYIVFRYRMLKDIRIVYIPARNIGEFGGESDNWVWPRHSGDFSFVRAYVSTNGQAVEYSERNVPYQPKEYLNVNADGVNAGDFVFVLGYPGRTFRHQPAAFVEYHEDVQLPYISQLYDWQINKVQELGKTDETYKIRMDPRIKSLANVKKNYQGKLKSLNRLDFTDRRREEEKKIGQALSKNPQLQKEYNQLLKEIDSLYSGIRKTSQRYMWYNQVLSNSAVLRLARSYENYFTAYCSGFQNDSTKKALLAESKQNMRNAYRSLYKGFDTAYLTKMFADAKNFDQNNQVPGLVNFNKPDFWPNSWKSSKLLDSSYMFNMMENNEKKIKKFHDPFIDLHNALWNDYIIVDDVQSTYQAEVEKRLPRYVDIRMEAQGQQFVPDANSTLRLTYGRIKGYEPADGVFYEPVSTMQGLYEKDGQAADYNMNEQLKQQYLAAKEKGDEAKAKQTINILYNTDTSGGNSGSPILNAQGQLVGVNFDRSYEATINDYGWDDAYSRSIGVDIRFVIYVLKEVAKANHIIDELFVEK